MAKISNIRFSAERSTDKEGYWLIKVEYDASFIEDEVNNSQYYDRFKVYEDDSLSDDDLVGGGGPSYFTPAATLVRRVITGQASEDKLDTELGSEELYAVIELTDQNSCAVVKGTSKILSLSI